VSCVINDRICVQQSLLRHRYRFHLSIYMKKKIIIITIIIILINKKKDKKKEKKERIKKNLHSDIVSFGKIK